MYVQVVINELSEVVMVLLLILYGMDISITQHLVIGKQLHVVHVDVKSNPI